MIICSCNVLSDGDIKACLKPGPACPRTTAEVYRCFGCSPKCGRCVRTIRALMNEAVREAHSDCASACEANCPKPLLAGRKPLSHVTEADAIEPSVPETISAGADAGQQITAQADHHHATHQHAAHQHAAHQHAAEQQPMFASMA